jgi:hypothetical protein
LGVQNLKDAFGGRFRPLDDIVQLRQVLDGQVEALQVEGEHCQDAQTQRPLHDRLATDQPDGDEADGADQPSSGKTPTKSARPANSS